MKLVGLGVGAGVKRKDCFLEARCCGTVVESGEWRSRVGVVGIGLDQAVAPHCVDSGAWRLA